MTDADTNSDAPTLEVSGYHIPVMPEEVLTFLDPMPGEVMLDATLGGGGHSALLAEKLSPGGTLVALDRDPEAIAHAGQRLRESGIDTEIILISTPFGKMETALFANEKTANLLFDGIFFDLGVSSHQLDTSRGFSFRRDEPLDMRMDPTSGETVAELLRRAEEAEIARILWEYGEERFSRQIAREIVRRRNEDTPVTTTGQLADLIGRVIPRATQSKDINPATRSFQALRIEVNGELDELKAGLAAGVKRLKPGGRIVLLSYHSLEDRIVKQFFMEEAGRTPNPSGMSPAIFAVPQTVPRLNLLTRKPVPPGEEEIYRNPRARSARLRAALKPKEETDATNR